MKFLAGLNGWALIASAVVSFLFGGLWYGVLSDKWMRAAGLDKAKIDAGGGQTPVLLALTFVCQLIMAWMLAGLLLHMAKAGIKATSFNGMISAAFIWLGFVATVLVTSHRYQMRPWSLTLIDGGYWLAVLLIHGAILGSFGLS